MSADHIRDRLAQAGVDAGALGAAETLSFPAAAVDEARAPVREGAVGERPLAVRSDVLAAIGLAATLDRAAGRLAFSAPADLPFRIDRGGLDAPFALDMGAADANADAIRTDLVDGPDGAPVEFAITAHGCGPLALGSVHRGGLRLQGLHAWPAPPLAAWRDASGDAEWRLLAGEAAFAQSDAAVPGSRWTATLMAGRVARLLQPLDAPSLIAARKWSRTLTAGQRGLVERYATVAARQLTIRLERLQSTIVPDEPGLVPRWRTLCYDRDDLEGIRVLLREAKTGDAVAAALLEADVVGRALRFSWPSSADVHDERLQRVAEGDPGAWWGGTRRRAFVL